MVGPDRRRCVAQPPQNRRPSSGPIRRSEGRMQEEPTLWVVYLMTINSRTEPLRAICEQSEWDRMEQARPGYHPLIQAGIRSEREAELLARGTSGDRPKSPPKPR